MKPIEKEEKWSNRDLEDAVSPDEDAAAVATEMEIDADAPRPRSDVFLTKWVERSSKLTFRTKDPKDTNDLLATFAKLRGEAVGDQETKYEKPEKPRTGCEGFCMPGFCKGPTCKHPPDNYPVLKDIGNCMAHVLNPRMYESMRGRKTCYGAGIDDVIQNGAEKWLQNIVPLDKAAEPGQVFPMKVGCLATDADCYKVFPELFNWVVFMRHNTYPDDAIHPQDCNPRHIPADAAIRSGNRSVVWCSVQASRNISGFPFAPAMTRAMRGDVDYSVTGVLDALEDDLKGKRFSLDELPNEEFPHFIPVAPPPSFLEDGVYARDWPHGRWVWAAQEGRCYVQSHVRDHMSFVAALEGADIRDAFVRLVKMLKTVEKQLLDNRITFQWDPNLGYLGPNPANLGTAMTFTVRVRLPFLVSFPLLDAILLWLRLRRRHEDADEEETDAGEQEAGAASETEIDGDEVEEKTETRVKEISLCNVDRLGATEVECFIQFVESVNELIRIEEALSSTEVVSQEVLPAKIGIDYSNLEKWQESSLHLELPSDVTTKKMLSSDAPDLSINKTEMAKVLVEEEGMYDELQDLRTKNGFTFRSVIQVGVDNPGGAFHFRNSLSKVGAVAGDKESYVTFGSFFNRMVDVSHENFREDGVHLTDFDLGVTDVADDLDLHFVTQIRIDTARNIRGFPLAPLLDRQQRRLLERITNHCLGYLEHKKIDFEVKGRYIQYANLTPEQLQQSDNEFEINCCFFPLESRILYKKAGILRDWPDARGFWMNSERTLLCRINEVDHITFTSFEKSNKMKKVFNNHKLILEVFEERLQEIAELEFMRNPHLGFLTTCPGDLGTAMVIVVRIKLNSVPRNPRLFQRFLRKHHLDQEPVAEGVWNLYNTDSLGYPENQVADMVYEGSKKIILLDKFLSQLESDEWIHDETTLPIKTISPWMHCDQSWFGPNVYEFEFEEEKSTVTAGGSTVQLESLTEPERNSNQSNCRT